MILYPIAQQLRWRKPSLIPRSVGKDWAGYNLGGEYMSAINPNGTLYLVKDVPFTPNYSHVIVDFGTNKTIMDYITDSSRLVDTLSKQNYIKSESGKIRVSGNADAYEDVCYLAWDNADIDSAEAKNVYAFVLDMTMINPNVVEFTYKVDVFQTYVVTGRATFGECLIERKTPSDDRPGIHIEPEPFTPTKYDYDLVDDSAFWDGDTDNWPILWFATRTLNRNVAHARMGKVAGLYQGENVYVISNQDELMPLLDDIYSNDPDKDTSDLSSPRLSKLFNDTLAVMWIPDTFITQETGNLRDGNPWTTDSNAIPLHQSGGIGEYTNVKYNKCYTYPYNMLHITDGGQVEKDYAYEFFYTDDIKFEMTLAICPTPEIMCVPRGYKTNDKEGLNVGSPNYNEKIVMSDFPPVPYYIDSYANWVATDKTSRYIGLISGLVKTVAGAGIGIATGGIGAALGAGAAISGISDVTNFFGGMSSEGNNADLSPDTIKVSSPSAMLARDLKTFLAYDKHVNEREIKRIDDYFSRFGYAINKIQTPSISIPSGRNQCYIKTVGCLVKGACPAEYCREIENIFNKGVTMWKHNTLGNYN